MALPAEIPKVSDLRFDDFEFWESPGPHREAAFEAMRREPRLVYQKEFEVPEAVQAFMPQGPGYFCAVRHSDVLEASRNAEVFCSGKGSQIGEQPEAFNEFFGSMINMDDPKHGRLRRLVSRGFTPRALGKLEANVQQRARATVDRVIDKGECDFVTDIAAPLPLELVCDIMGIPDSQTPFVFDQTNVILGLTDPEYVAPGDNLIVAALTAGKGLADVMNELAKERRANPTDDLTSQLLNAEVDGDSLSPEELASFFVLLVVAGNETTRNAISHGMKALCDFPDERRKWAADFEGVAETAIDEMVRWASPVVHFRRTATRDTEIRGTKIEEGQKVVLWYNSANRDADVFPDPYRFDVTRTPNEHVGFGGPGPHYCLGANLAKREMRVMFREIFDRLPDLEITGEPEYLRSMFIHGIKHMPCAFTPGG
jgi:cytochrome P450